MSQQSRANEMGSKYDLVIITGGSSGIGCSIIEGLITLDPDTQVFNLSRRFPKHFTNCKSLVHIGCDLSNRVERSNAFTEVERRLRQAPQTGKIALINNAGFGLYGDIESQAAEAHLELLEVNLCAPVELTARLLPILKKRGGSIVNIASTAAFQPTPHFASYGASKSFILNWTQSLNHELRGSKVNALVVCPGPTRTEFFRRAGFKDHVVPAGFSQSPETVAQVTIDALSNKKSLAIPGPINKAICFFSSLLPIRLRTRASGRVIGKYRQPPKTD